MPAPGPVALVGAGEFLPAMADFDLGLLAATGRPRPRVAVVPTASWPDGEAVFQRWAAMGVEHFSSLGAEVEPVLVRDRADADDPAHAQAIGEADLVYLSGGKPGYLAETLEASRVGRALWDASRHVDRSILPSYAQMLLEHVQGLTHEENERQSRIMAERGLY